MAVAAGSRLERQAVFVLEQKSPQIFENMFLNNGVLAALGMNGRVNVVRGSDEFHERVHFGKNPNTGFLSKTTDIPTAYSNNFTTAKYAQAVLAGAVRINLVEEDQNAAGEHRIDDMVANMVKEANRTFPNTLSNALMASTSGANEPLSIVEEIEATAYGTQTGTCGNIERGDHTGAEDEDSWQNQYISSGISDLGSASGLGSLIKDYWTCSPGGSAKQEQPDVALTTTGVLAKIAGGQDVLRNYGTNDKMVNLGFDNFKLLNAAIMADRNVSTGYLYFLNTNYLRFQVLGGKNTKVVGEVKTIGDGKQTISLQVRPAVEAHNNLSYVIKIYLVCNLTFGGLRQHGLVTSITEAT